MELCFVSGITNSCEFFLCVMGFVEIMQVNTGPRTLKKAGLFPQHGLTDPLPPMQPLNFVVSLPPEAISCKRKFEKLCSNQALAETKQGFENGSLASGSKSKIQVANVNKNPIKKCGFVVKAGACGDGESKADQGCVTTLNAHIDKCLSVDSGQQPISKPRRKVKRMVDIYATAKRCTLEDLDQRNGTKWDMSSSYSSNKVVSDNNKPQVCNKRKKRSVLHANIDEDAATIGPVYIDAKGQKLRIISEFNEKASEEDVSEKESSKEGKGNYRGFRERLLGKKYHKHCKCNASEVCMHVLIRPLIVSYWWVVYAFACSHS